LALSALVFGPSLFGGFMTDDVPLIPGDPRVHDPARFGELLASPFWSFDFDDPTVVAAYARIHRPLVKVAFVLGDRLGDSTIAYHAIALLVHALVVALAFRWLDRRELDPAAVFAGAIVFAIHPTRLESVAWISGLSDTLMTMFAFVAAEIASTTKLAGGWRRWFGVAAVFVAGACSAASKEVGVIAAPIVVLFELDRGADDGARRRLAACGTLAAGFGGCASLMAAAIVTRGQPGDPVHVDLLRPVAALGAVVERIFVPFPSTLEPYPLRFDEFGVRILPVRESIVGVGVVVATLGLAIATVMGHVRGLLRPIVFFLLTLAPTLGFEGRRSPGLVYDRFLYLPLFGVCWFAAASVGCVPVDRRRLVSLVVVAILVATIPTTRESVIRFGDQSRWFAYEAVLRPNDPGLCASRVREAVVAGSYRRAADEIPRCIELARSNHRLPLEANLVLGRIAMRVLETPDRESEETRRLRDALVLFHDTGVLDTSVDDLPLRLRVDSRLLSEIRTHVELIDIPISALSIRLREFDVAIRWMNAALRRVTRTPDAWMTYLTALARAGRFGEARRSVVDARLALPSQRAIFDGFEGALGHAEAISRDPTLPPEERAPAVADALQDPYGVLLADHDRCEAAVSPRVTARCVRSALALRDPATAIRYLELRAVVAPDERPAIDRAIRSIAARP